MLQKAAIITLLFLCIIPYAAFAFNLPDTGQTNCFSSTGTVVLCAGTGQDGAYNFNPMSYKNNGDGTVTDNNTGLMWQRENDHNTYNWYQASGTFDDNYNPSSQDSCGSLVLGGYADWRLPSKKEMLSLVDYSLPWAGPTINQTFFPNTEGDFFWSSNTYGPNPSKAWYVFFANGGVVYNDKGYNLFVRCVRGGKGRSVLIANGDGTVTDYRTGLMWQQDEPGDMPWGNALAFCEGLSLAGHSDWRLPNIREIESLTKDDLYNPAIDTSYFPDALASDHWSSTTNATDADLAWLVSFNYGSIIGNYKSENNHVRCVCGGQGEPILPVWINMTSKYYNTIQDALDGAVDEDNINVLAIDFTESLTISKSVVLEGGYNVAFTAQTGSTTLDGTLTVTTGSLTLENLHIQ